MNTRKNRMINLVLALVLMANLLTACGGGGSEPDKSAGSTQIDATESPATTEEPATTQAAADSGAAGTWLIMMYEDGDDPVLERDIYLDMNEAEIIGSTDNVTIVAQFDRYKGGFDAGGDITSTKRYLIKQDSDPVTINSEELEDLGELNMSDPQTLVDFASWAISSYPAEHYVLIMSDHGGGWTGGYTDPDPAEGASMSVQNIDDALAEIISQTGIGAFEMVGFDACLMGQAEVMSAIAPHAKYAVGSEETEPSLGWAYSTFLGALNDNPNMTGGDLAGAIVDSYIGQDMTITNDELRTAMYGDVTGDVVATEKEKSITLTAVDLGAMQNLDAALNNFALALTNVDQGMVAEARAYAQSYESVFGHETPPSFIDLGNFVDMLASSSNDANLQQSAGEVKDALAQVVLTEKHGNEKPGSSGLTIFFPNSDLYQMTNMPDRPASYTNYVGRFAAASLWDDFLTFHYTGQPIDPAAADLTVLEPAQSAQTDFTEAASRSAPAANAQFVAPGGGEGITIAPLTASAEEIGKDGTVTLSTEISGSNIGYIYIYVAYYDEQSDSFLSADSDFISAENTKELNGIYYPDWGDTSFPLEYEWTPTLWYMSDGNPDNDQRALFSPETYGASDAENIYTVRGVYTYVADNVPVDAIMSFNGDGVMQSIFGFSGDNGAGSMAEIRPQPGDTFTITDEWLEFDKNPDGEYKNYDGGVMTFGDTPFTFTSYSAYPGKYVLGIIVEDLNGNTSQEFIQVNVTE
jgi:hypothetical protein